MGVQSPRFQQNIAGIVDFVISILIKMTCLTQPKKAREKVSVPMWIFPYMLLQWWRRRQRQQQLEQLTFHCERLISSRNISHRVRGYFAAAAGKSAVGFLGRSSLPPTPLSSMSVLLEGSHYFHYMKHSEK